MISSKENNVMLICVISVVGLVGSFVFCCCLMYLCLAIREKIDYLTQDG